MSKFFCSSANAAALLSSRLSLYLKRPWTALAPCPIAKELIPVHPRKVFFYLTTCPHQPLPEESGDIIAPSTEPKQITPSLSSASIDMDDADDVLARERARLSPSPEVDLSPDFDEENGEDLDDSATTGGFGSHNNLANAHGHRLSHTNRSASPPLEGDEREFTQTATSVRERTSSEELASRVRYHLENGEKEHENNSGGAVPQADSVASDKEEAVVQAHGSANGDYFEGRVHNDDDAQDQDLGVTALFGTSPSPSVASELSSSSSSTSVTSDVEPEVGLRPSEQSKGHTGVVVDPLNGNSDATTTIGPGISSSKMDSGLKRPFSVLETTSIEDESPSDLGTDTVRIMDGDMETSLAIAEANDTPITGKSYDDLNEGAIFGKPAMHLSLAFSAGMESWNDLRSPETVELDELDEIFADI